MLALVLVLATAVPMHAAGKKKAKTFTQRYRDERVEVVMNDLAKQMGYTYMYDEGSIDIDRRITYRFKDMSPKAVLRKLLGKDYKIVIKRSVVTITHTNHQGNEILLSQEEPMSVVETDSTILYTYIDTLLKVRCFTKSVQQATAGNTVDDRWGHVIKASVGVGYSNMGMGVTSSLADNETLRRSGFVGSLVELQYGYFFAKEWGISVGLGFSQWGGNTYLTTSRTWKGVGDSEGEAYDHSAATDKWQDRQVALMVDVPIKVQYRHTFSKDLALSAALGAELALPVYGIDRAVGGSVSHTGYYSRWNLNLHDIHTEDFFTEQPNDFPARNHEMALRMPAVAVLADLGVTTPVNAQLDFYAGAYFQYTCNDINATSEHLAMGWQNTSRKDPYHQHTFMPEYPGIVRGTTAEGNPYVETIRPWMVGVKVGLVWHHSETPKKAAEFERLSVCDTTRNLVPREQLVFKDRPARSTSTQIRQLMTRSVIWFDLDSDVPKLVPIDILDKVADILLENPEQIVNINGHASQEGNEAYNMRLSLRRAQAVANRLQDMGVPASQIRVNAFSASQAYVPEEGQGLHDIGMDRRVEIIPVEQ